MVETIKIPIIDPLGIISKTTSTLPISTYDPIFSKTNHNTEFDDFSEPSDIDEKINTYQQHLEKALRYAPCPGCKKLVLGALTGAEIYREMEKRGLKKEELSDEDIQRIKNHVELVYGMGSV